jgi:hypothetical protein
MNWQSGLPGIALGLGVVLIFKGIKRLCDKSVKDEERRKGYWSLNGGLLLVAISIIVLVHFGGV